MCTNIDIIKCVYNVKTTFPRLINLIYTGNFNKEKQLTTLKILSPHINIIQMLMRSRDILEITKSKSIR